MPRGPRAARRRGGRGAGRAAPARRAAASSRGRSRPGSARRGGRRARPRPIPAARRRRRGSVRAAGARRRERSWPEVPRAPRPPARRARAWRPRPASDRLHQRAHVFTHYGLLILATAVLAMVLQEPGVFGTEYGPILALGTGMFVVYGLGSLPMGWLAERFGRPALMVAFFLGTAASWRWRGWRPRAWLAGDRAGADGRLQRRSTTRSARRCWWMPRASAWAAPSASTASSAISASPGADRDGLRRRGHRLALGLPDPRPALHRGRPAVCCANPTTTRANKAASGPSPIPRAIVRRAVIVLMC
jgi:hypothetical protein